jgi:hypothetical protein
MQWYMPPIEEYDRIQRANLSVVRLYAADEAARSAVDQRAEQARNTARWHGWLHAELRRAAEQRRGFASPEPATPSRVPSSPATDAELADARIAEIARKAYAGLPADASSWQRKKAFKRAMAEAA